MDAVRQDVELLVKKELEAANKKFPLFRSAHEGYAVILEEADETGCALKILNSQMYLFWQEIKSNTDVKELAERAEKLKRDAIDIAVEAIQTSAMSQKFIDSIGDKNNG